jgi:hypothetical protein
MRSRASMHRAPKQYFVRVWDDQGVHAFLAILPAELQRLSNRVFQGAAVRQGNALRAGYLQPRISEYRRGVYRYR